MKKVLVTGANGQLGRCLKDLVSKSGNADLLFVFMDKNQLDITQKELVETFFFSNKIDFCVNCAAYTNVDLAETEVEEAFRINSDGPAILAQECFEQKATLIHISTDYVFDGSFDRPYLTDDIPQPINVYGKSKLEGEKRALNQNPKTIIVRTSWLYSQYGRNFYTTMVRLMKEKDELNIVNDQFGKPTHAADLASYIYNLILNNNSKYGIHHFAGKEVMSWYEFAKRIAIENGFKIKINPISSSEYPTPAKRPKWSVLG